MARRDDDELERLARTAAQSDEEAFRLLVERVTPVVFSLARRQLRDDGEAEDIVQETAIRVWQKLPTLRTYGAVLGWICRIARNLCTDRIRARGRRPADAQSPETMEGLHEAIALAATDPEQVVANDQARAQLPALIDELKPAYRTVFLMHVVDDLTASEIAAALGCAVGTVESRLSRGRRQLLNKLERSGGGR